MSIEIIYMLSGIILFVLGLFALFSNPHLLSKILALNIMGSGVFMVLIAAANRESGSTPDPVPHAMVLTGIVVAVSATTLGLAISSHLRCVAGRVTLPDEEERE